jgi:hypothetical protein
MFALPEHLCSPRVLLFWFVLLGLGSWCSSFSFQCRVCGFCLLTVWWVPNVVCVVCVVFVFLLCGGCPMLSVSCVWFLSSYCVVGAQCCLCRLYSFCRLTVWWVPNVVCVVCIVFVFLLCGGCPLLSVLCLWFYRHDTDNIGHPSHSKKTKTTHTTQTTLGTHHTVRRQKL